MSVAYYSEVPNVSREQVDRVSAYINERMGDGPPDGGIFHADGPTDEGGWWAFEVYASEEQFTRFHEDFLAPAFMNAGMGEVPYRRLEVAWDSTQPPG